jgi:hypothetical protein
LFYGIGYCQIYGNKNTEINQVCNQGAEEN